MVSQTQASNGKHQSDGAHLSDAVLKKAVADLEENGYAVIENFLSEEEVEEMKRETLQCLADDRAGKGDKVHIGEVWECPEKNEWYSACSDAKTRLFYEPHAVDKKELKLLVPPERAMCKMGFALHKHRPYFQKFVTQKKIMDTFEAIGFKSPVLIQSMVNFKNPRVGGEFIPHQDAQYLTTTDPDAVIGHWVALDDATEENGCVEFIPGSHKWSLCRRYTRPKGGRKPDGSLLEWTAPMAVYDQKMYTKVPAKKGALVLIHGLTVHKSEPNHTDKSRWAFVFHTFDAARCKYIDGWLPADAPAFIPIAAN